MKISTNSIGNYKPIITQKKNNIEQVNIKKNEDAVKITSEEKKFFSKMYPNNTEQITNYHFYNKEGDENGVSLGSLFDKRG
jgi:ribosomal protein L5